MYLFLFAWFSFFFLLSRQISLWILFLYTRVSWEAAYRDVMTLLAYVGNSGASDIYS